jgi:O-antigen ligase
LGWDEHMNRMFSVFFDPNFAGAFFVLFFLFLMNMFLQKRSLTTGLLIILTLGAVFLTFSRSALLMLIVSSCILFTFLSRKKLIVWLLLLTIIVIGVSSSFFDIANINLFRVVSSEARLETARNAIKIIEDHPLFGIGFNSYRYAQFRYNFRSQINLTSHADSSPDNSLLLVLATTGIVGFILYLYFWFRLFKVVSILAIASVAGIFVDSMFINSLFYPLIMFWLWIILAFSIKNHN